MGERTSPCQQNPTTLGTQYLSLYTGDLIVRNGLSLISLEIFDSNGSAHSLETALPV